MDRLFASGAIVDVILLGVAAEAAVLTLLWWRAGRGPDVRALLANIASGAALMFALRASLTGEPWPSVAMWMLGGLVCHLADLALRFRAGRHAASPRAPVPEPRPVHGVHASDGFKPL